MQHDYQSPPVLKTPKCLITTISVNNIECINSKKLDQIHFRAVIKGGDLQHLLWLSVHDFPVMLQVNMLLLIEFTHKVTSLL